MLWACLEESVRHAIGLLWEVQCLISRGRHTPIEDEDSLLKLEQYPVNMNLLGPTSVLGSPCELLEPYLWNPFSCSPVSVVTHSIVLSGLSHDYKGFWNQIDHLPSTRKEAARSE